MTQTYLVTLTDQAHPPSHISPTDAAVTWWQSVENPHAWRAYMTGELPVSMNAVELKLLTHLNGASYREVGNYHYIVETDISNASEEEFNAWYETEHLPGLAHVPGTVSAKRYVRLTGSPRYIACYELLSPTVMDSDAWLAVRHTAWSSRVRPMFTNTVRALFIRQK